VTTALRNEAPWTDISFGYYGRPLGERRRRVALFADLDGGPMAAVVSTRWSRDQPGPRWTTVWQILGGLRGSPAPAGAAIAQVTPLHVH
jgi:hypothetical protein